MIDIRAVGVREWRAFDEENVLYVELCAPRDVIETGNHGVIAP